MGTHTILCCWPHYDLEMTHDFVLPGALKCQVEYFHALSSTIFDFCAASHMT